MRGNWTWFFVGVAVGVGLGWYRGSQAMGGAKPGTAVTGAPNSPFQRFVQTGR